ncbi:MAG: conserved hypothetical membrane protein, partial [uncultured Blastococcus sp.]
ALRALRGAEVPPPGQDQRQTTAGGAREPGEGGLRLLRAARGHAELRLLHRRHRRPRAAQPVRAVRGGRGQPDRDGAQVRRPHPDRCGAPGHQPGGGPPAHRRRAALRLRHLRLQRRHERVLDGERRLPLRRRAPGQHRLRRPARRGDGLLPPRL